MKHLIKDEKIKKLLKEKYKLELLAWLIPLISICSLLLLLIFASLSLQVSTLILAVIIIILIIVGYVFDNRITSRIKSSYNDLNQYFQDNIVPQLLVEDNPTIVYNEDIKLSTKDIDNIELFNNFTDYYSYFHYEGIIEGCKFTFDEVMFDNLVEHDTIGKKVFNNKIKKELNYHWYTIEINKEYPCEAIYKVDNFDNYDGRLIRNYYRYDLSNNSILNPDSELQIFIKDLNYSRSFVNEKIMRVLNDDYIVYDLIMAIYINQNKVHIVLEEYEDLIDLAHSNKVTIDNLLSDYKHEQRVVKAIVNAFNK